MSIDFLDELIGNDAISLIQGHVGPLAIVEDGALVEAGAEVVGKARVTGSVRLLEGAKVGGYATVTGDTVLRGNVRVGGFAVILGGEWTTGTVTEGVWREPGVAGSSKHEAPRYKINRYAECWGCGSELDFEHPAPMIRNDLWLRMFPRTWIVCTSCLEKKLGRKVIPADLI